MSESDTYWDSFCGCSNQYSAFWSPSLTVNTSNPDFTQCFQDTIFVWVPCGFLWICSLFYIPSLMKRPVVKRCSQAGKLNLLKLIVSILLCLIVLMDFFKTLGEALTYPPPVYFVSPAIYLITFILSGFLISYEFRKGILSSGVLFLFWFLLLLAGIVSFRSRIIQLQQLADVSVFRAVTFFIYFTFVCVEFVLHLWADTAALPHSRKFSPEKQPLLSDTKAEKESPSENRKPCPQLKASFLNRLTFGWITGLVISGYRHPIEFKNLTNLLPDESCRVIVPRFLKEWNKEMMKILRSPIYKFTASGTSLRVPDGDREAADVTRNNPSSKNQPSLFKALVRTFGPYFAFGGFMNLIYTMLTFVNPLLLNLLISFIESGDPFVWRGYMYGVLMFVTSLMRTLIIQQYWDSCFRTGLRTRTAVIAAVYRKALKLSNQARKNTTVGEIVNLMSVDAQKMQEVPGYLHMIWISPLTIAVALVFLFQILGPASLAGLAVMLLLIPINGYLATRIRLLQVAQMRYKDTRLKMMNEVLNGMKVLKMYAWEKSFQKKIEDIRNKELRVLRKAAYLNASASISWFCAPFLVALASFATYVLSDPMNILDANTAFVSLNLFSILNYPMSILPQTILYTVQAVVSINRIERFLKEEELDPNSVERTNEGEYAISVDNASFVWDKNELPALKNIDVQIEPGTLVAVVGQVGSGKSSFIEAIMGEMERIQGKVSVKGTVAYVAQQAWIQNQTVKENILFGQNLDQTFYKKCLSSCALEQDLKILPGGDQTEIGEKGINLSGGQKQRVSVARAVYQDCDIYLMDDPLSAVDSHVGKHIFNEVIGPQGILKSKTRILCTNSISCLPKVDKIIVLTKGEVSEVGAYQELLSHNGAFAEFIQTYLNEGEDSSESEDDEETMEIKSQLRRQISLLSGEESGADSEAEHRKTPLLSPSGKRRRSRTTSKSKSIEESLHIKRESKIGTKLIQDEFAETGSISLSVLLAYFKALGMASFFITVLSYIGFLACMIGSSIWLNIWSSDVIVNGTQDKGLTDLRLGVYGAFGGGQALFVLIESLAIATGSICASGILHSGVLKCIMKTPMAFFDTTPLGRIVNRFSKDLDTVDITIPMTLRIFLATFSNVLSTLVVIIYSTPIFIVVIIPLGILYYFVQRFYVSTVRQLQRIDSLKRSPIYSHFGETIVGASSIRAYGQQERFMRTIDKMVDENQVAWFPYITSNRWLGVSLETIGSFIVLFASLFAVIARESAEGITSGEVGLSVSFALQVTASLNYMVRMSCDFETQVVAVERIKEYSELNSEAAWDVDHTRPPPTWPQNGKVEFSHYSLRYRPGLDLVLRDINCEVQPGEKVGIVGRTGAGKSSLTLALFRIIEPAAGRILIDGVDIAELGLHQLRQKVTIIPQDPVLFSGTLRMNLDPFDKYTDNDIWNALELSHLKGYVTSLPQGLEHECTEGGENLSVGQRQLVCLGRALLRKTKILILDEATAAVDMETDDLIQSTIRTEFKECSVLTIAHRLNTIMDYDRVMVLDSGVLKEYEAPSALLMNKKSIFYGMARDAGLV